MTESNKEFNLSEKLVKIDNSLMIFDTDIMEFIRLFKIQIDEWEYYEKRFPHKETKWNRLKCRIDKLAGEDLVK